MSDMCGIDCQKSECVAPRWGYGFFCSCDPGRCPGLACSWAFGPASSLSRTSRAAAHLVTGISVPFYVGVWNVEFHDVLMTTLFHGIPIAITIIAAAGLFVSFGPVEFAAEDKQGTA